METDDQPSPAPTPRPNEEGKRTDVGYCRPPVEHQFPPGVSGNPAGRPPGTAGATFRTFVNDLVVRGVSAAELRKIAADETDKPARRIAASRILVALDSGSLAAFGPYLRGEKTLEDLAAAGINTAVVKKAKTTAKGDREIELHDGGIEYDRLVNSTELTPGELEKNKRLDEGKATELLAYQVAPARELELPDFLKGNNYKLPPPLTASPSQE